jgi:hypothetical protein
MNFSTICCAKPGLQAQEDEEENCYRKDKPQGNLEKIKHTCYQHRQRM